MPNNHLPQSAGAVLAAALLATTLTACGDDGGGSSPGASQTASNGDVFNEADVTFATDMIPHHAQAIEMVTLSDGRSLDPRVQQLADAVRNAQAPEVETMSNWLTAWGEEVPETSIDHSNAGHSMEGMEDMPGMMSEAQMSELENASDAEFQTLWLEMMREHHEGAIEMAQTEQADGEFTDAVDLAETIETTQEAEIEEIDRLLEV